MPPRPRLLGLNDEGQHSIDAAARKDLDATFSFTFEGVPYGWCA